MCSQRTLGGEVVGALATGGAIVFEDRRPTASCCSLHDLQRQVPVNAWLLKPDEA